MWHYTRTLQYIDESTFTKNYVYEALAVRRIHSKIFKHFQ